MRGWRAKLSSGYRGLSLQSSVEFRDFTVLIGPNNGGKTQYLRSLVLLDAVRRSSFDGIEAIALSVRSIFGPAQSIAQALIDAGFREFADEIAALILRSGPITIRWEVSLPRYADLADFTSDAQAFLGFTSHQKPTHRVLSDDVAHVEAEIGFDRESRELVLNRLVFTGLWFGLELHIARSPPSQSRFSRHDGGFSTDYEIHWMFQKKKYLHAELVSELFPSAPDGAKSILRDLQGYALTRPIRALLPRVEYVGPTRITDDRLYHVASRGGAGGVGRAGEYTWAILRGLTPEQKKWLDSVTFKVLGLQNLESSRQGPTTPRVTASLGENAHELHDYGLGTSQALPLLVQLALQKKTDQSLGVEHWSQVVLVVMEEPESHLHPAAQRALARVLVEYLDFPGKIVIETHSEIMLKTVAAAIAGKAVSAGRAIVNWIDFRPKGIREGPRTRRINFTDNGDLDSGLPPTFDQVVTELIEERLLGPDNGRGS